MTSTAGLCPCPAPKPSRPRPPKKRPLARRDVPPAAPAATRRADPTAATARFLKAQASALTDCAPPSGQPLRLHLEVEVAPAGQVEACRITNLVPVPPAIARCVQAAIEALEPPPFDAVAPERFALTVVL